MPGIFGIIDLSKKHPLRGLMEVMQATMVHEPWYVSNFYCNDHAGLGRVDLGRSSLRNQPVFLGNGKNFGVMDGRIYDLAYEERSLRARGCRFRFDNEAEIALQWFETCGPKGIETLNGSFVAAHWNDRKKQLTIFNDRFGFTPLYFVQVGKLFAFATELKALLALPFVDRIWDRRAVADFFTFGYLLNDETFFTQVKRMPPATVLRFSGGTLKMESYWTPEFEEDKHKADKERLQEFEALFELAVQRQNQNEHRIGALLSGGLDSRIIAAVLSKRNRLDHVFTLTDGQSLEGCYASQAARHLNAKYHEIPVAAKDFIEHIEPAVWHSEGQVGAFHSTIIALKDVVRENVDVIYDGLNILDAFYGFWETRLPQRLFTRSDHGIEGTFLRIFNNFSRFQGVTGTLAHLRRVLRTDFVDDLENGLLGGLSPTDFGRDHRFSNLWDQLDYLDLRYRQRRFTSNGALLLRNWVDVCLPFMDYQLVDFILRLPPKFRNHNKWLVRRALTSVAPQLAEIPLSPDRLPAKYYGLGRDLRKAGLEMSKRARAIFRRSDDTRHWGAISFSQWLREDKDLRDFVVENIMGERDFVGEFFNVERVKELLRAPVTGKEDHTEFVGNLLTFAIWHRQVKQELPHRATSLVTD